MKKIYFLFFLLSGVGFFLLVILSYQYFRYPVNLEKLPIIRKSHQYIKTKAEGNDGVIFSNKDKVLYEKFFSNNSKFVNNSRLSREISQEEIFKIIKNVKNS